MPKETTSVEAALAAYDREKHRAEVDEAESLRRQCGISSHSPTGSICRSSASVNLQLRGGPSQLHH